MPFNISLIDLVSPYVVRGENLGANHAALSVIRVISFKTASAAFGIVIRGQCQFNGRAKIDVGLGRLAVEAEVDEAEPPFDPTRRSPVFDLRETTVDFELLVPRAGSNIIASGVSTISAAGFTPTRDVLDVWDAPPLDAPLSDFPTSAFVLDLVLNAPTVRPPFLHPAKMLPTGLLVPDTAYREVLIRLPKLRFRLAHGNATGSTLTFELVSAGVSGLDDPGDIGVAELVSMEPAYAFIGGQQDRTVGFGFRKAVLDLAEGYTPPAITEKFGFGDDWGGLYLPEVRFFLAPEGARDFAFEAGVEDLLIGFGDDAGVSGDFELAVINQGSGVVKLSARFFDATGRAHGIERTGETTAITRIPEQTRMVVDIQGGRAPYSCTVSVGGGAAQAGRLFNINLGSSASQSIVINITDATAGTASTATLTITAERRVTQPTLPAPGTQPASPLQATLTTNPAAPILITIANQNDQEALLTTDPVDPNLIWSVDAGPETTARSSFSVPVAPGQNRIVRVRRPGTVPPPANVDFYFFFDEPGDVPPANENEMLRQHAEASRASGRNVSISKATSNLPNAGRDGEDRNPLDAYDAYFNAAPNLSTLEIQGEVSYEGIDSKRDYNYALARRRAIAVREMIRQRYPSKNFNLPIDPEPRNPSSYAGVHGDINGWKNNWDDHGAPNQRDWWKATVKLPPGLGQPERQAEATLSRPATPPPPPIIPVVDPPPQPPRAPDWFRSAKLKVRIVRDVLIAGELEGEIDIQTFTEDRLAASGQLGSNPPPDVRTLQNGVPMGSDNPADGITKIRLLAQSDQATGRVTVLIAVGADPADKDGLAAIGWLPGVDPPPPVDNKDFGVTLVGSYLSFWPLLVAAADANQGRVEDWVLMGAALAVPGVVAALPWFQVERVIWYGGEYLQRDRNGEFEAFLLADVQMDWSVKIAIGSSPALIEIPQESPLSVRYKAIGLRFGNREDGSEQYSLRPVFDSSRGYTIDVARGGALRVASPFDQILRVLGARLSRTNPLTFEVDLGIAVDLGVVSIERARVRVYLEPPASPELTAFGASIDIPGAIAGRGYVEISDGGIAGQIDITIRPVNLRVAAAIAITQIAPADGGPATAVYVALNVILPVGIPLGSSGLGIFGFRGIFGMHYERNPVIGAGSSAPALAWLVESGGQPHLLRSPSTGNALWTAKINQWAFGIGILIGTMEGGVIMNLDGTFILELPGPRIVIVMNARILVPPPSLDGLGASGGILAIIEITPDHFLIGILVSYEIERFIKIRIPVEAFFSFGTPSNWHIYLGKRTDYGDPIEVNVLDIVRGTGYLMFKGDGLTAYKGLPEVKGFAIGIGAGASFVWGNVDIGLYLRIGGSMDAVIGFDPFLLGGIFRVSGELRLFIISIGASAELTVIIRDTVGGIRTYIKGEACGHIDFFFFEISGCVTIEIGTLNDPLPVPQLVEKLSLKSRSPALLQGTGVDRPVDASLGDGTEGDTQPADLSKVLTVPIDSIPILAMTMPPVANLLSFLGTAVPPLSGVPVDGYIARGNEQYRYELTSVTLERISPAGPPVMGSGPPATWWTLSNTTEPNTTAQLALLTWEPTPASKAIEKSEVLKESIQERWGTICRNPAPPTPVLWTFRFEPLGASTIGWDLEGIALPDPPETRRSSPTDTSLKVTERWRSGNPQLDNLRGIVPALVIGGQIPCKQPENPNQPPAVAPPRSILPPKITLPRLVVGGRGTVELRKSPTVGQVVDGGDRVFSHLIRNLETQPFRISPRLYEKAAQWEAIAPTHFHLGTVFERLSRREAVTRAELVQAMQSIQTQNTRGRLAAQAQKICEARVLESPIFDDGRLIVFGNPAKEKEVAIALEKAGIKHGPLDDVIVLHTGAFKETTLLLLVQRILLKERLVVRTLDKDGNELERIFARNEDRLNVRPLPTTWTDPASPWSDDIADLLTYTADLPGIAVLLSIGGEKADRIEIGVVPAENVSNQQPFVPAYYVAVIESLRLSEIDRSDWDDTQIKKEREVITSVLGPASTSNALLFPNSLYKVSATWSGSRKNDAGSATSDTQSFWFRTDAQAPQRLDPWVLTSLPTDGETCVFGAEPVRLVFNTHDVDRLYAAYGKELRIRFQAASAHHPTSKPMVPHPFPINPMTLELIPAAILSPWEEALVEVIKEQGPCIPIDETRSRHSAVTVPIPLDPYTGYILDVVMVNLGAPQTEMGESVYRRHFSTGAYGTFLEFGASLQAVKVSERALAPGSMTAIQAFFAGRDPQGPELDEQMRSHGLEAMPAPDRPRVIVFWETTGNNPPQPTAVLVDAAEPLWRSRPHPQKILDNSSTIPSERWVFEPREWLQLAQTPGSEVAIAPDALIRAPGLQRALVVLPPNSQGKRLRLDLVAPAFPEPYLNISERRSTVVDITFVKAPWEE